jgi:sialate O-acetylesterase
MRLLSHTILTLVCLALCHVSLFAQSRIKVACVGNSVTYGYQLSDREKECYPARLQQFLGDGYEVKNFGHSGATLLRKGHRPYIQQDVYHQALAFKPDIVVIHLGLNDTDPRNWPNYRDEFIGDYRELIQSFRDGGQSPQIWICRMTPIFHSHPRFKSGTRDWFWQEQEAIETVAQFAEVKLIDLHTPLYSRPDLFADALHPDAEGASIIAKTVYSALTGDFGGLKPAGVFGHHMVLQQKVPIPVWGTANHGDVIKVKFNQVETSVVANDQGMWKVEFPSLTAGFKPYTLELSDQNGKQFVFNDILIGEVWLCAGQSNMEFSLAEASEANAALLEANVKNVRLLNYQGIVNTYAVAYDSVTLTRLNHLDFFQGHWESCSKQSAAKFSAIGYFFGKQLSEQLKVPIGLVQVAVGGSPAEAWIDRKTLEFHPQLVDILYQWRKSDMVMPWCRDRASLNLSQSSNPLQRHPFEPAYLFETGISPLINLPIKGVLWYQGESNAHNVELYEVLFPALMESWRSAWNNPDMPFYFAQLSSLSRPTWPHFRDAQRRMAKKLKHTGMVVTSDVGDSLDVHPRAKEPVGTRFAHLALSNAYGMGKGFSGSPEIQSVRQRQGEIIISFNQKLKNSDNEFIKELEAAAGDGVFKSVEAQMRGHRLIIQNQDEKLIRIRYGWRPFSRGNLVGANLKPVSTFKEDVIY